MSKRKKAPDLNRPGREWKHISVGLFVPFGETVYSECVASLMRFSAYHGLPQIDCGRSPQLDMTRTRACKVFLETPRLTHLLMLDADHTHPLDVLPKLARWVPEAEVVAGLNFNRGGKHKPCCYFDGKEGWDGKSRPADFGIPTSFPDEVMQVAAAGTGSMLLARTALEKLDWPFFEFPSGDEWRPPMSSEPWPGEDIGFAANCRRNGVKQYVDVTAVSPHLSHRFVGREDYDPSGLAESCEVMRRGVETP